VLLIDISSSLSRPIYRDQVQTVSTTLEQLMTVRANQTPGAPTMRDRSASSWAIIIVILVGYLTVTHKDVAAE